MKKIIISLFLILFLYSCDTIGSYSIIVENKTETDITIKFHNDSHCSFNDNPKDVIIMPGEDKIVRIIEGALNTPSHDWLSDIEDRHIKEILFDTYADGEKIEKELWQRENWTYHKIRRWKAEYKMVITNDLLEEI